MRTRIHSIIKVYTIRLLTIAFIPIGCFGTNNPDPSRPKIGVYQLSVEGAALKGYFYFNGIDEYYYLEQPDTASWNHKGTYSISESSGFCRDELQYRNMVSAKWDSTFVCRPAKDISENGFVYEEIVQSVNIADENDTSWIAVTYLKAP